LLPAGYFPIAISMVLGYTLCMIIFLVGAAVLLAIDLITKALVTESSGFIPGLIGIDPIRNYGAAFGIFQDGRVFFIIVTFVILAAGIFFYVRFKKGKDSKLFNIGCAFILGGALGNLYDRLFLGFVRDFIRFEFLNFINFPICNFADVFLNVGIVLLAVYFIFMYKGKESKNANSR
jgi:signal peptidase II